MNIDQIRQFSSQINEIAHKYGVSRVFVFGSVARGEANSSSDLDLLIEMRAGSSLFGAAGFCYEVENMLGIRVDVVPLSVLPGVSDRGFVSKIQEEAIAL